MNDSISFEDLLSFLKEYKKQIVFGFIFSFAVIFFLLVYSGLSTRNYIREDKEVEGFSFILENKEGAIISNTGVVKSVLVDSVEEILKVSSYKEVERIQDATEVTFDATSSMMAVTIDNSYLDSSIKNLADLYFKHLANGDLRYFENKNIYIMDQKPTKRTISAQEVGSINLIGKKKILVFIVVWVILGLSISSLLIFRKNRGDKTIKSKFYLSNETINIDIEKFHHLSFADEAKEIKAIIDFPKQNKFVVCNEKSLGNLFIDNEYIFVTTSLSEVSDSPFKPCEILIICTKGKTPKKWYELQMELVKNYNANLKSIFISGQ
ncbi:hypothetical protein JZO70_18770 [Enterococcus sp. 669A]|uniref:Capsular polysaccharide biosynthesis protein CpsC n=1 Tax=Candidatus Enterococcus moelleringii TaxID=2815325 RepID=A0ABS3LF14_9ENTE|nr:hypothetical protein [Enterococcus sp. 669A]MBO1308227.1 hypothetical protein [Enterococcus sp. 669A]